MRSCHWASPMSVAMVLTAAAKISKNKWSKACAMLSKPRTTRGWSAFGSGTVSAEEVKVVMVAIRFRLDAFRFGIPAFLSRRPGLEPGSRAQSQGLQRAARCNGSRVVARDDTHLADSDVSVSSCRIHNVRPRPMERCRFGHSGGASGCASQRCIGRGFAVPNVRTPVHRHGTSQQ